jgi:hypothetical protein
MVIKDIFIKIWSSIIILLNYSGKTMNDIFVYFVYFCLFFVYFLFIFCFRFCCFWYNIERWSYYVLIMKRGHITHIVMYEKSQSASLVTKKKYIYIPICAVRWSWQKKFCKKYLSLKKVIHSFCSLIQSDDPHKREYLGQKWSFFA